MSYMRLINQCGLYEDKIRIFLKNSACGLYTGALNRPKITVIKEHKAFLVVLVHPQYYFIHHERNVTQVI